MLLQIKNCISQLSQVKLLKYLSIFTTLLLPTQSWSEINWKFDDHPELQATASTLAIAFFCLEQMPDELNRFREFAMEARNEFLQQLIEADFFSADEMTEISDTTLKGVNSTNYNADSEKDLIAQTMCSAILEY